MNDRTTGPQSRAGRGPVGADGRLPATGSSDGVPGLHEPTLCAAFERTLADHAAAVAVRGSDDAASMTFAEIDERSWEAAGALSRLGVGPGDVVLQMLTNRPEFHLIDLATLRLGAAGCSIYNTNPAADIAFAMRHTRAPAIVTEGAFAARVVEAAAAVESPPAIVVVDGPAAGTLELDELPWNADDLAVARAAADGVRPETIALLTYTSGTTGTPKAVMHQHATLLRALQAIHAGWPVKPRARVVSHLPMAHIAERLFSHVGLMACGTEVVCCREPGRLPGVLADVAPTRLFTVPRVFDLLRSRIEGALARDPDPDRRAQIEAAVDVGRRMLRAEDAGEPVPAALAAEHAEAERTVLSGMRRQLGLDRLDWVTSGGAATHPDVIAFFRAIGVDIAELWGMSEPVMALMNRGGRARPGTVGTALPGVDVVIAEDDELLVRGPATFVGYLGQPELYREVVDDDGWVHTGDLATMDPDGNVTIVGRKSEMIVSRAGKNMSPARIEAALRSALPLVGQCMCVGDGRAFNVALLTLDPEAAATWARTHGRDGAPLDQLAEDEAVRATIAAGVEEANARLSDPERIRRFALLDVEWTTAGGALTATSKVRRHVVLERHASDIDRLYAATA